MQPSAPKSRHRDQPHRAFPVGLCGSPAVVVVAAVAMGRRPGRRSAIAGAVAISAPIAIPIATVVAIAAAPIALPLQILLDDHHPLALRRAVELGDGFVGAGSASTATFAEQMNVLRGILAGSGRDPASFPISKRVYLAIDRDRDRAVRRLAEWFRAFYGRPELAGQVAVCGDVGECLESLGRVVQAGAGLLMLNPVFDEMEHLERFASELSPKL